MVMIYNSVLDEWDNKGAEPYFHHLRRWAWNTLGQAKSHVATVLSSNYRSMNFYDIIAWYLGAEFIQETIPGDRIELLHTPCTGYVRRWLADHERSIRHSSPPSVVDKIEALGVWKDGSE